MNDMSIQGGRTYAAAYASNEAKMQAPAPAEAVKSPTAASSDTVLISAQARELFQQSSINDAPIAPTSSDQSVVSSGNKPGQVTLMNGGGGVRPPESP